MTMYLCALLVWAVVLTCGVLVIRDRAHQKRRQLIEDYRVNSIACIAEHEAAIDRLNQQYGAPAGYRFPGEKTIEQRFAEVEAECKRLRRQLGIE